MTRLADALDPRLDAIVEALVPLVRLELILLFGSRANGEPRDDSDYDIMLVLPDGADTGAERGAAQRALGDAGIPADVLTRAASDYLRRQHDPACLEWLVSREGRVLHARGATPQRSPAPRIRERPTEGHEEWLRRSEADYVSAESLLSVQAPRVPVPDAICFHAHGCVEKLLKALIAAGGSFPPRTHDLKQLLSLQHAAVRDDAAITAGCELLQKLYPHSRYPELPMPTLDEARAAFDAAAQLRARLQSRFK